MSLDAGKAMIFSRGKIEKNSDPGSDARRHRRRLMVTSRRRIRRVVVGGGVSIVVVAGLTQLRPAEAATGELGVMSWNVQGTNLSGAEATGSTNSVVAKI